MATYTRVPRSVPSSQRNTVVTDVVATDEIDVADILGRPARRIKIVPDDSTDEITIRLNNRLRLKTVYQSTMDPFTETPNPVYVTSHSDTYPAYVLTGGTEYYTEEGLSISYITVEDIVFGGGGSSVTIYVW